MSFPALFSQSGNNHNEAICRSGSPIALKGQPISGGLPNDAFCLSSNGQFRAVFNDVVNNTNFGFDDQDPILANLRRQTVCDVLNYIASVIVLPVNIGDTDPPITILFENSVNTAGPLAGAAPFSDPVINSFDSGYAYEYITTGTNPAGQEPHGHIEVNYNQAYHYDGFNSNFCIYDFLFAYLT